MITELLPRPNRAVTQRRFPAVVTAYINSSQGQPGMEEGGGHDVPLLAGELMAMDI